MKANGTAIVAICVATPLLASCMTFNEKAEYFYPASLGHQGDHLVAWPADSNGDRFRYLIESYGGQVDTGRRVYETGLPPQQVFEMRMEREDALSGVLVLLPLDSSNALLARARAFQEHVTAINPVLSTASIRTDLPLSEIETPDALIEAMRASRSFHHRSLPSPFVLGVDLGWPDLVVVPVSRSGEVGYSRQLGLCRT